MAIFKIGGTDMPSPSNISHSYRSIGKSEENAAGNMVFDRLALKHDITVDWKYLDRESANTMVSAAVGATFVDVYFYDPQTQSYVTQTMRPDVSKIKDFLYDANGAKGFTDISIKFQQR